MYLYYFLKQFPGRTLVFTNSKDCIRRLVSVFTLLQCNPLPLHADMHQRQRLKNLEKFSGIAEIAASLLYHMSRLMGKPTICICENKDADHLGGNREADQRLCFHYTDSTLSLLLKSEISSFQPASALVQVSLCRTRSETTLLVFPRGGSYYTIGPCLLGP